MKNDKSDKTVQTNQVDFDDHVAARVIEFAQKSGITPEIMGALDQIFVDSKEAHTPTGNMTAVNAGHDSAAQQAIFNILQNASTATAGRMMCGKGWGQNLFMSSLMFGEVCKFFGSPLNKVEEIQSDIQISKEVQKLINRAERDDPKMNLVSRSVKAKSDDGLDVVPHSQDVLILKDRVGSSFRPITRVEHMFLLTRLSQILSRGILNHVMTGNDHYDEQMGHIKFQTTGNKGAVVLATISLDCTLPERIKKQADKVLERLPAFKRTRDYSISRDTPSPTRFVASYVTSGVGWRAPRSVTTIQLGFYLPAAKGVKQ